MGLLEKAMEYKKEINRKGRETLIDKITGPAETEFIDSKDSPADAGENDLYDIDSVTPEEADKDNLSADEQIKDISDKIYEIKLNDEINENEDKLGRGEDIINDDLFELPEDDNNSPIDILNSQKEKPAHPDISAGDEDGAESDGKAAFIQDKDDSSPLGPDDEPVFSILKDRISQDDKKYSFKEKAAAEEKTEDSEDIDIITSSSRPDGQGGKNSSDVKPAYAEKLPAKEKSIGKFLEDEGDNDDEVVYSFNDFQDFPVLYEIIKDISRADTKDELYDVILFSINGQIGCSSSSVMIANLDDDSKWFIANSLGIDIRENLFFNSTNGILKNLKRNIIDIDVYEDDPECEDQYEQLLSIDTKLIAPIVFRKKILGALILGEKITGEPYSEEDFGLILSVCNASATLFNKVATIERLNNESLGLKSDLDYYIHLNGLQDTILRNASIRSLEKIIQKEFEYLWVEYFSVFIKNERDDTYIPFIAEADDFFSFKESGFRINNKNLFIDYVRGLENGEKVEMFDKLEAVKAGFDKNIIKKMSQFWIYPFKVGKELIGFITVFKIRDKILEQEIDRHLRIFSKLLLSSILSIQQVDPDETRYVDNIELILKRINVELSNAKQMNIPLTLILLSIKNFKRYANMYGYAESVKLINSCVDIFKSRLADSDFSARIDRNKILIVLPGKDKKFAIHLANFLRNEIMQGFKRKEMQLLITFLMAEFPVDGDNLQTLLDSID